MLGGGAFEIALQNNSTIPSRRAVIVDISQAEPDSCAAVCTHTLAFERNQSLPTVSFNPGCLLCFCGSTSHFLDLLAAYRGSA